jgi:predicted Rossmann fold nucleotide-binding protein DprA/Smf involved in DNA uptake
MKLAVIGSRSFTNATLLAKTLAQVKTPITCIISGGASGADKLAEQWAILNRIETEIFLPDYKRFGIRAPLVRNNHIVDAADNVLAFWDGKSSGTGYTINYARKQGKTVHIVEV